MRVAKTVAQRREELARPLCDSRSAHRVLSPSQALDQERSTGSRRPSALEWLGAASPASDLVAHRSSSPPGTPQSKLDQWCSQGMLAAASASKGAARGERDEDAGRAGEEDSVEDEEGGGGVASEGLGGASSRGERQRRLCGPGVGASRAGSEDDNFSLREEARGDDSTEWPKLDASRQHFSSKKEPIVLCENPAAQVPAHIACHLREYQRDGVIWLFEKYRANTGGILGDMMGLGKTVQTAVLLIAIFNKRCTAADVEVSTSRRRRAQALASAGPTSTSVPMTSSFPCSSFTARVRSAAAANNGTGACKEAPAAVAAAGREEEEAKGPVMIVCPASLVRQWKSELLIWAHFEVGICEGKHKEQVLTSLMNGELEVFLCSYQMYVSAQGTLNQVDWECVIFDECHQIKNPRSEMALAANGLVVKRRIGLTGTLMQNKMEEMYTTLSWAVPGALGEKAQFKEDYENPIKLGNRINAKPEALARARLLALRLHKLIQKHVLRREKDMIKDQVPSKEDNIVICPMSDEQKAVYARVLSSEDYDLLRKAGDPCNCGSKEQSGKPFLRKDCCYEWVKQDHLRMFYVDPKFADEQGYVKWYRFLLPAVMKLLQLSNHLDLVRVAEADNNIKKMKDIMFAMTAFDSDDPAVICQSSNLSVQANDASCGKMSVLKSLLSTWYDLGDKVLLFSYSVRMLNVLEKLVIAEGHTFLRLDGNTPPSQRLALCDKFNHTKDAFIFLISTRAGGLGLNLTAANKVVIFDPNWNPAYDIQAQDRAYRIGQRRDVAIYRLISADSIEELVYQRQIYKQQSSNIVMKGSHERRYFEGVQGVKGQEGELFGLVNLLGVKKKTALLRQNEKREQLRYEIRLNKVALTGVNSDGAGTAEEFGEDGDDDDAWKIGAQDVIAEEVGEEDGHDGMSSNSGETSRGKAAAPGGGLSVEALLKTLDVHRHTDIVGESDKEVQLAKRVQKVLGIKGEAGPPQEEGSGTFDSTRMPRKRSLSPQSQERADNKRSRDLAGGDTAGATQANDAIVIDDGGDEDGDETKSGGESRNGIEDAGTRAVGGGEQTGDSSGHGCRPKLTEEDFRQWRKAENGRKETMDVMQMNCQHRLGMTWEEFLASIRANPETKMTMFERVKPSPKQEEELRKAALHDLTARVSEP